MKLIFANYGYWNYEVFCKNVVLIKERKGRVIRFVILSYKIR